MTMWKLNDVTLVSQKGYCITIGRDIKKLDTSLFQVDC